MRQLVPRDGVRQVVGWGEIQVLRGVCRGVDGRVWLEGYRGDEGVVGKGVECGPQVALVVVRTGLGM